MELVKVGTKNIPVVPQRHARLRHLLSADDFQAIMTGDYARAAVPRPGDSDPRAAGRDPPLAVGRVRLSGGHGLWALRRGRRQQPDDGGDRRLFREALMVSGANRLGKIMDLVGAATT